MIRGSRHLAVCLRFNRQKELTERRTSVQVFAGGFGGDLNNAGDPETHQHQQKTPQSTAADCRPKTAADNDRKSRDIVGDDDVKPSPRELLSF